MGGYGCQKKFIHLFVDHATRYAWAFSHKNESSDVYISCLKQIMVAGKPKTLLTDRGGGFTSSKFKHFTRNAGIKQQLTSSQHPQINGINERTNQTIMTRLRCKMNTSVNKSWPKLLDEVIDEYNKTPHDITGFPPCFLMYGIPHIPTF